MSHLTFFYMIWTKSFEKENNFIKYFVSLLLIEKKISHKVGMFRKSKDFAYRKEISVIEPKSERCVSGEK